MTADSLVPALNNCVSKLFVLHIAYELNSQSPVDCFTGSVCGLSRPGTGTAAMMVMVGLVLASFGIRSVVKGKELASVDGE